MHLLAAPDKFRGTATAAEAAAAMGSVCASAGWTCTELPLADGGEGTLEAFGGANRESVVTGPLGTPVPARWRLDGADAIIEMAQASGLLLAGGRERNDPMHATSRGTGELIEQAILAGATRILVGVGGSASTDGGSGAVDVLRRYAPLGDVVVASDVRTLFVDAARVFAPQKGADAGQVATLTDRLTRLAGRYRDEYGVDVAAVPGSGAAGGLAGGLAAMGARIESGFDVIAGRLGLRESLRRADLVITGEGMLDPASYEGKVVGGVVRSARDMGVPSAVVVGQARAGMEHDHDFVSLTERYGRQASLADTARCIAGATLEILAGGAGFTAQ